MNDAHDQGAGAAPTRSLKAEYQSKRRKRGMTLVFRTQAEKDHYVNLAGKAGMNLQDFILAQLAAATSGVMVPPEVLAEQKESIARLTCWHDAAREEATELRKQLDVATQERDDYRLLLAQEGKLIAPLAAASARVGVPA